MSKDSTLLLKELTTRYNNLLKHYEQTVKKRGKCKFANFVVEIDQISADFDQLGSEFGEELFKQEQGNPVYERCHYYFAQCCYYNGVSELFSIKTKLENGFRTKLWVFDYVKECLQFSLTRLEKADYADYHKSLNYIVDEMNELAFLNIQKNSHLRALDIFSYIDKLFNTKTIELLEKEGFSNGRMSVKEDKDCIVFMAQNLINIAEQHKFLGHDKEYIASISSARDVFNVCLRKFKKEELADVSPFSRDGSSDEECINNTLRELSGIMNKAEGKWGARELERRDSAKRAKVNGKE